MMMMMMIIIIIIIIIIITTTITIGMTRNYHSNKMSGVGVAVMVLAFHQCDPLYKG